jgi:P27 family predicted phage terminase small subunit
MTSGGHNRKSGRLHVLSGTYRKDRHSRGLKAAPLAPECPEWLDATARELWQDLAPRLEKLGLISELDRAAFAAFVSAYSLWRRCEEQIEREGLIVQGHRGVPRKHPLLAVSARALEQMRAGFAEFGLTPRARQRLDVNAEAEADDFDRFLDGGSS